MSKHLCFKFFMVLVYESFLSTTNAAISSATTLSMSTDIQFNCSTISTPKIALSLKGRLLSPSSSKSNNDNSGGGTNSMSSVGGGGGGRSTNSPTTFSYSVDDTANHQNSVVDGCGFMNISKDDSGKPCIGFGQINNNIDESRCVKMMWERFGTAITSRTSQCILILYSRNPSSKLSTFSELVPIQGNNHLFIAEIFKEDIEQKVATEPVSCPVPIRSNDEDPSTQDSLLNNFSRTSVLFVSVSFIILMVISLAWLVFYYVQRFRYAHAKDRLARRLFNAAKKALTKIPAKTLRQGDKELDSDCPVCIEPYHAGDVIRILPCKHVFHKTCVDPWLLEHRTCPMCKMDILKAFGYHFGHSEESVRDADQMSAGGQSTDGGSGGTGPGGRSGSGAQHGFPMSLPTDSDLHDPFFPSPIPSPSLLQPVLHSSNAQSFTIIPLTVHRHHGGATGSAFTAARGSDSSADSADNWVTGAVIQRQHSAEVHHGAGTGVVDSRNKTTNMDDNHNETTSVQRNHHHHRRHNNRHRDLAGPKPSNVSTASSSSSNSSASSNGQQVRQPLFHSRSAGMLRGGGPVNTVDSCESDDGDATRKLSTGKRKRQDETTANHKFSAIVSRGRSASQTITSATNKARVAVNSTPPPTAAGHMTTTTTVIGRASSSSLSSTNSDCVVVGVVNSNSTGRITSTTTTTTAVKGKRNRNAVGEQPKGSASLESL